MSDYANKLFSLAEKKQKLFEEEAKLIEKRKKEIGNLAEKFQLLTVSDEFITGLLLEAQAAIKDKSEKVKNWEIQGERFLKQKRAYSKATKESSS